MHGLRRVHGAVPGQGDNARLSLTPRAAGKVRYSE